MPKRRKRDKHIEFDEIFFDATQASAFDRARMEGTLEVPLSYKSILGVGAVYALIAIVFASQLFSLQVVKGDTYQKQSENNRLDKTALIAERGVIYDRNEERIAWNESGGESFAFPERAYTDREGLGPLIGHVSYPKKDSSGVYYRTEYKGQNGLEEAFDETLSGENGERFIETNAVGEHVSQHVIKDPDAGVSITLSLDAELSEVMHDILATTTAQRGFRSGAAAMMDVRTGEIIAMANFPSYDPEVISDGLDEALIASWNDSEGFPFLNKVVGGVYIPGSVVKPFLAYAALNEEIVTPEKEFVSKLNFVVPNPYDPDNPTIFRDWRAHGPVDVREAIAVSSNVYFYHVGGGSEEQEEGLGISRIYEYMSMFGFGERTGIALKNEQSGNVPNPKWKREIFDDDWRLGDTYLTSIGQFGFQTTPLQLLRAYAALANGGKLFTPHFEKDTQGNYTELELDEEWLTIVQEGMRRSVTEGTARSIDHPEVEFAGKTGTAEVGKDNAFVNTWVAGYMPYEDPQYAFVMMMEHGPRENLFGAAPTMRSVIDWMVEHRPEYVSSR